jgi:hypothetical protein
MKSLAVVVIGAGSVVLAKQSGANVVVNTYTDVGNSAATSSTSTT